jgi:hypothetical protein
MRKALSGAVLAGLGVAVLALGAAPAGAGAPPSNTLTIVKQVTGTVPAGTTFTVQVDCVSQLGSSTVIPTVTFDSTGQPTTDNHFNVGAGHTCTITETEDGGATSVAYQCQYFTNDEQPLGQCDPTDHNVVHFGDVIGDSATITVTNTFPTPPPPTTTTTPPSTAPAAVQAAPTFTG